MGWRPRPAAPPKREPESSASARVSRGLPPKEAIASRPKGTIRHTHDYGLKKKSSDKRNNKKLFIETTTRTRDRPSKLERNYPTMKTRKDVLE